MSFFHYLILGMVAYGSGFGLRRYFFDKDKPNSTLVYQLTPGFFVLMLPIAFALNLWALHNSTPDYAFIIMCSLVASFIFYQGLAVDKNHQVPD